MCSILLQSVPAPAVREYSWVNTLEPLFPLLHRYLARGAPTAINQANKPLSSKKRRAYLARAWSRGHASDAADLRSYSTMHPTMFALERPMFLLVPRSTIPVCFLLSTTMGDIYRNNMPISTAKSIVRLRRFSYRLSR